MILPNTMLEYISFLITLDIYLSLLRCRLLTSRSKDPVGWQPCFLIRVGNIDEKAEELSSKKTYHNDW